MFMGDDIMLFGKYLNKYYIKYLGFYIIGVIGLVIVDYFQLYIPVYLGKVVDLASSNNIDINLIAKYVLIVVGVAFLMFLGRMLWRFSLFNASLKTQEGLRNDMFNKALVLSERYYHENKVGNIMALYTTDLETIEEYLGWGFIMLFDAVFLSLLVAIKMVLLDWILALIALIPMLLIVIWGLLVEKYMSLKWKERQEAFDELYDFSQENFTGIRVIKAFVKGTSEIFHFSKIARKNKEVNITFARLSVLFDVLISLIIIIIMSLLMGVGGYFTYCYSVGSPVILFGHEITLKAGDLVTFIGYFDIMIWPMMALGQIVSRRSRAKASYSRISKFLDEEVEIENPINAIKLNNIKGNIKFNNFSFNYPNCNTNSLNNISLEIKAGELIGVVGKIGSGKTTLAKSLLRLYNVPKNRILIDDIDIMDCDIKSIRDSIGYVPQDNFLFSEKIRNNIALSNMDIDFSKIKEAAIFSDVDNNIIDFKDGYDTITGERGVSLSGGQKQRISIARAYIKNAPIMIMDDSVSAVDIKTEEKILENIKKYRKGKTTIVIASRVSTVVGLDRILVLNNGEVEAFDKHENLLNISPTYQRMVYLQALEEEVKGGK